MPETDTHTIADAEADAQYLSAESTCAWLVAPLYEPGVFDHILVLDTETTGFATTDKVIELAYVVYTRTGVKVKSYTALISYPGGLRVRNSRIHGITSEMLDREGIPLTDALDALYVDLLHCNAVVAHNISFDMRMLTAAARTVHHEGFLTYMRLPHMRQICTMGEAKRILGLATRPKLVDIYAQLCVHRADAEGGDDDDEQYIVAHRALDDTVMCAKVYFALQEIE